MATRAKKHKTAAERRKAKANEAWKAEHRFYAATYFSDITPEGKAATDYFRGFEGLSRLIRTLLLDFMRGHQRGKSDIPVSSIAEGERIAARPATGEPAELGPGERCQLEDGRTLFNNTGRTMRISDSE